MVCYQKKWLLILSICVFFSLEMLAQKKTRLRFNETEYDFGETYLGGGAIKHCFVFYNEGEVPLLIKDVRSSCGCAYGSWLNKPVAPGDSGSVCVTYKNNMSGTFRKKVKVISNAQKTSLVIKGTTVRK